MSMAALKWAKQQRVGDPLAKLVLLCLADATNARHDHCFPSQGRLAEECECSRQSISKKLGVLERLGLIRRELVTDDSGRKKGCLYWLVGLGSDVNNGDIGMSTTATYDVADRDIGMSTDATGYVADRDISKGNPKYNPKKEPSPVSPQGDDPEKVTGNLLTLVEPDLPDLFDEFWKAYPRREAKPAARKAWERAMKRAGPWAIIAGAKRYRDDPNRDDAFTAHPSTWLNQDRWNDGPLPPRGGRSGGPVGSLGSRSMTEAFDRLDADLAGGPGR